MVNFKILISNNMTGIITNAKLNYVYLKMSYFNRIPDYFLPSIEIIILINSI